jgi:hypothetical protein
LREELFMLIPGDVVPGNLLPWALFAPVLPLLLLLLRRMHFNATNTSLVLLCVVSILSSTFLFISDGNALQESFIRVSFVAEFIFTGLLLKTCTDNKLLSYSILTASLVFLGIFSSFCLMGGQESAMEMVSKMGVLILFLFSLLVLASKANKVEEHITSSPDFWFTAGIFFHFGLLSLLLFTAKKTTDLDFHEHDQFSIVYVIIFCLQFIFFSIGLIIPNTLETKGEINNSGEKKR